MDFVWNKRNPVFTNVFFIRLLGIIQHSDSVSIYPVVIGIRILLVYDSNDISLYQNYNRNNNNQRNFFSSSYIET